MNMNQNNVIKTNFNNNMINNQMGICFSENNKLPKNIINEDNQIVPAELIKYIMKSGIDKCICKITTKINTGTGFFCNLPNKNLKLLITNNHEIDETFLNNENILTYSITEMENEVFKEINLKKNRYILTNKDFDFTIIEILKDDHINNYLEINNIEYNENDIIFSF